MTTWSPPEEADISMVGHEGLLDWEKNGEGFVLQVPEKVQKKPHCQYAWVFRVHP
jgi:hypothetical protein